MPAAEQQVSLCGCVHHIIQVWRVLCKRQSAIYKNIFEKPLDRTVTVRFMMLITGTK